MSGKGQGRWDFSQGFRELSQYLLDHVDHRDGEAVVLAFAIFRESRKENFGLEEIGKCLEKARAESEAGKNGEEEEKEVSRNRTGGQTGTEEEKRQDLWKMDTENGERGSGEWMKERRTEKSSSRVCGSDHGRGGERDKVLKTVAIAVPSGSQAFGNRKPEADSIFRKPGDPSDIFSIPDREKPGNGRFLSE